MYLPALHAMKGTARPHDSPAQEGAVKECSNTAHEQLVLNRDTSKIDSLIGRPDGHLSSHGGQEVLLKLMTHLLYASATQHPGKSLSAL